MTACPKPVKKEKVKKRLCKQKKCKVCKSLFTPRSSIQKCCSIVCGLELAYRQNWVKQKNIRLEKLKTLTDYLREAQAECNAYIRERDRDKPCISCNRFHNGKWNAGHYRTVKAAPQLRYNEDNLNKQCEPCNSYLSGNVVEYRINLIKRIGIERVEALENSHTSIKYTIEDAKRIRKEFKDKRKQLKID